MKQRGHRSNDNNKARFWRARRKNSNGNHKLFYQTIKTTWKVKTGQTRFTKRKSSEVLTDETEIMRRWDEERRWRNNEAGIKRTTQRVKDRENSCGVSNPLRNVKEFLKILNHARLLQTISNDWEMPLILPILGTYPRRTIQNHCKTYTQWGINRTNKKKDEVCNITFLLWNKLLQNTSFAYIDLEKAFHHTLSYCNRGIQCSKVWRGVNTKLLRFIHCEIIRARTWWSNPWE